MVELELDVAYFLPARLGMNSRLPKGGGGITRPLSKLALAAMLVLAVHAIPISGARAQDQLMVTPQGSDVIVGRWRELLVQLSDAPPSGTEVTVTWDSGGILYRYNPPTQIVLDFRRSHHTDCHLVSGKDPTELRNDTYHIFSDWRLC